MAAAIVFTLLTGVSMPLRGQSEPRADSLVAQYLELGVSSNWHPSELFDQCLPLSGWRGRVFDQLSRANLTPVQARGLALAWVHPLRNCQNAQLEQWYFDQIDASIQQGATATEFWVALLRADSPRIREYLERLMLDINNPVAARSEAGTIYFERFEPAERLQQYLHAFETALMPEHVAFAVTQRLLREQPDRLLDNVSRIVHDRPELADQMAFSTIAQNSHKHASDAARERLAAALEAALQQGVLSDGRRDRLNQATAQLRRRFGGSE